MREGGLTKPLPALRSHQSNRRGVPCPKCQSVSTGVTDSRPVANGTIRRRRGCRDCGSRFTTYEIAFDKMMTNQSVLADMRRLEDQLKGLFSLLTRLQGQLLDGKVVGEE